MTLQPRQLIDRAVIWPPLPPGASNGNIAGVWFRPGHDTSNPATGWAVLDA